MEFDSLVGNILKCLSKNKTTLQFLAQANKNGPPLEVEGTAFSGWEKWLQVRLAEYLCDSYLVSLETRLTRHQQKSIKGSARNHFDLMLRPHNKQNYHIGVELKVDKTPGAAIKGGLTDLRGFYELKLSEWNAWKFRGLFSVALYKGSRKSPYETIVEEIQKTDQGRGIVKPLGQSLGDWKLAVFGWEAKISNAKKENFDPWYKKEFEKIIKRSGRETGIL